MKNQQKPIGTTTNATASTMSAAVDGVKTTNTVSTATTSLQDVPVKTSTDMTPREAQLAQQYYEQGLLDGYEDSIQAEPKGHHFCYPTFIAGMLTVIVTFLLAYGIR